MSISTPNAISTPRTSPTITTDALIIGFGKGGKTYGRRASLALETQHFPDSPNHPGFPSTVLGSGQRYRHVCVYKFSTR